MDNIKIGISIGDINGIGMEVILKTLDDPRITQLCTPVVYGSSKVLSYHKNIVNIGDFPIVNVRDAHHLKAGEVNVVNCWQDNVRITLGKASEESGKFAYVSLDRAVQDLNAGLIDALVTAPINKHAMQLAGFPHTGHTEFLTAKANVQESLMLMVNDQLRVALATNHIPISEISKKLNKEVILRKLILLNQSLKMDFGIQKPKIALLGLNPHAGDEGSIGKEEQLFIIPAIQEAKSKGIFAVGPYPADGFFGSGTYQHFDAVLAMYHDQGLVGFKSLSFESGVNFTAGLPFVRTSPDHGTAYNITGQNKASADSFREALFMAIEIVKKRADYKEMYANPLNPVNIEEFVGAEHI
jgi:4-phospho-D-threonate 3-dehydrogenase / 4-phospho-D-erythronate 3-dehydrogenase